jgi:hypothetical protein
MKQWKKLLLLAAFCVALGSMLARCAPALAGPRSVDGSITLAAASTAETQNVALASEAWDVDRIVFYNAGAVTAAVTVTAADLGVYTAMDSYALAAGGGQSQWPRRAELSYHQSTLLDTNDTAVSALNISTNYGIFTVRDIRIVANKNTNAAPVILNYRIYGRD